MPINTIRIIALSAKLTRRAARNHLQRLQLVLAGLVVVPVGAAVAVVAVPQEVVLAEVQRAHAFHAVFVVRHLGVDALVVFVAVDAW